MERVCGNIINIILRISGICDKREHKEEIIIPFVVYFSLSHFKSFVFSTSFSDLMMASFACEEPNTAEKLMYDLN